MVGPAVNDAMTAEVVGQVLTQFTGGGVSTSLRAQCRYESH
jgi:hypothetical protein